MKSVVKVVAAVCLSAITSIATAGPIDLGGAGKYTLLAASPSGSALSGLNLLGSAVDIHGDVGGRTANIIGTGSVIHGDLDGGSIIMDPSSTVLGNVAPNLGNAYWDSVYNDLVAASDAARSLGGASTGDITATTTFNAADGLNVLNINGEVNLQSGEFLTISGDADDQFVINISERIFMGSGAGIRLEGGISADNVVFNLFGDGLFTSEVGGAELTGTFISPRSSWIIGDGATMNATRILAGGIHGNLQTVIPPMTPPPTPVSAPSSLAIFMLAFGFLVARRKKA